jgi:hypothetical protein
MSGLLARRRLSSGPFVQGLPCGFARSDDEPSGGSYRPAGDGVLPYWLDRYGRMRLLDAVKPQWQACSASQVRSRDQDERAQGDGERDDDTEDTETTSRASTTSRVSGRRGDDLTAAKAAQRGLREIAELTGKQTEGVTGVEPAEDGWIVGVEVVEDRRIPSSTDILATYEAEFDGNGELLSYRRVKRNARGRGDSSEDTWHDLRKRSPARFRGRGRIRGGPRRRRPRARQPGRHPGRGAGQGARDRGRYPRQCPRSDLCARC